MEAEATTTSKQAPGAEPSSNLPKESPKAVSAAPAVGINKDNILYSLKEELDRKRNEITFSFAQTEAFRLFSWWNPLLSGAAFALFSSLFLALSALSASLPSLLASLAVAGLVGSGVIHLLKKYGVDLPTPTPRLPGEDGVALQSAASASAAVMRALLSKANAALSWEDAAMSGKALAYAWLASDMSFFFRPGWLFVFGLLAFTLTPLYVLQHKMLDAHIAKVDPLLLTAKATTMRLRDQAMKVAGENGTPLIFGGALAGFLFLYIFWNVISFSGLFSVAALVCVVYDRLTKYGVEHPKSQ